MRLLRNPPLIVENDFCRVCRTDEPIDRGSARIVDDPESAPAIEKICRNCLGLLYHIGQSQLRWLQFTINDVGGISELIRAVRIGVLAIAGLRVINLVLQAAGEAIVRPIAQQDIRWRERRLRRHAGAEAWQGGAE